MTEVVVVGAGIVGAACAEALACAGRSVTVVDTRPCGGATAAGMGHVLVVDDDPALLALTAHGRALWEARAPQLPSGAEWDACGTLWVAEDDEEMAEAARKADRLAAAGVDASVVDGATVASLEPCLRPGLAGGLRVSGDRVLYPPVAAQWLLDAAKRAGAQFRWGHRALSVGEGKVELDDGTILEAAHVVVAAGCASLGMLRRPPNLGMRPRRGHLAITEAAPGLLTHQLVELGYVKSAHSDTPRAVAFNLQPRVTGQLLVGSSREFGPEHAEVDRALVAEMLDRALRFVPALAELSVLRVWTGFRAATEDKRPFIGRLASDPTVMLATGHEGLGITTSLATGEIVRDLLDGQSPAVDATAFRPDRGERVRASA